MGQDGEDREGRDADLSAPELSVQRDIADEMRFERRLAIKAVAALLLVAAIVVVRQLWLR